MSPQGDARPDGGRAEGPLRARARWWLGAVALAGLALGVVLSATTLSGLRYAERLQFCAQSCHEMQQAYREYTQSVHYRNDFGVRAVCADCHVPKPFFARISRHIEASTELIGKFRGYINTAAKYEQHRAQMAQAVWNTLKLDHSAECQSCHNFSAMDLAKQPPMAARAHSRMAQPNSGQTCIDCHMGIAHTLPPGSS